MTETSHTRSRRASLYGLLLQVVIFVGVFLLSQAVRSSALLVLAWYLAGGILIWFVSLLVFRQRELAALEALDLEELRREKKATGGGEAIFDEEGGGALGYRVAKARLEWMQRWLIPVFGLLHAIYLAALGLYIWFRLSPIGAEDILPMENLPIAMIALALVMVILFLFSRYTSGMGRVTEWKLLRASGSYMLGNALAALAVIICLGVHLYAGVGTAEQVLAYVLCGMMIVLAIETLFSFMLDIYRPRMPDTEPRACFDSRLLALIAEPGGIASTIAEAMNYQFGFEVSQTWFYQLLQRTFIPLLGAGAVILWLLTCVVIVPPGQHAIIERWGRQLNTNQPLSPGFYWKWPWPKDVARKYDTGRLHQIIVGFKQYDAEAVHEEDAQAVTALWTDERHWGQEHFDFLTPVPPLKESEMRSPVVEPVDGELGGRKSEEAWPINMVRMDVAVQYKISERHLDQFTQSALDPHVAVHNIAWEEVVRYTAAWDIFSLLGEKYGTAGNELRRRVNRRIKDLRLGLEVVYVGVQNVHPETTVAKEFRKVVTAEQEKIASIRQALVKENEVLSAVAGNRDTAHSLAQAIGNLSPSILYQTEMALQTVDAGLLEKYQKRLATLKPKFTGVVTARWRLKFVQQVEDEIELDFELGLGRSVEERARARQEVLRAKEELARIETELEEACAPVRAEALRQLDEATVTALFDNAAARFALEFWQGRLRILLPAVQGEAAKLLAEAQAKRWGEEMDQATEVARLWGARDAYRAAPRIYKTRKYLEVLVNGIRNSRKFFLAFDPGDRQVRVHFIVEEQARPELSDIPTRLGP